MNDPNGDVSLCVCRSDASISPEQSMILGLCDVMSFKTYVTINIKHRQRATNVTSHGSVTIRPCDLYTNKPFSGGSMYGDWTAFACLASAENTIAVIEMIMQVANVACERGEDHINTREVLCIIKGGSEACMTEVVVTLRRFHAAKWFVCLYSYRRYIGVPKTW